MVIVPVHFSSEKKKKSAVVCKTCTSIVQLKFNFRPPNIALQNGHVWLSEACHHLHVFVVLTVVRVLSECFKNTFTERKKTQ